MKFQDYSHFKLRLSIYLYDEADKLLLSIQDMIGQKQYEITDHLGNVLSTVSDQHLGRDINGDSVIDYYNAVIPAAYDYYPFGMLMPFRYTQDNSTHCATITTDKLYPVWVHHNIILNNGTTPIANSYGSGVATVLTGGTGINIYSPMITSGASISVPLQQKLAYNMDLNIQSISGSYSAQVLDSDSTVLGAITIAESGNFSLSYSAPTASPVTLVFKAQSTGSDISVLAAGYWVFTHQSQMVTMTICDQNDNYRFGFNGQMKTNEIAGFGNHNTAFYWEYETRTGRRWNLDPKFKKIPSVSPYSTNLNNPILSKDANGDFGVAGAIVGSVIGGSISLVKSLNKDGLKAFDSKHRTKTFLKASVSAAQGAIIGATDGLSLLASSGVGMVAGTAESAAENLIDGKKVDWGAAFSHGGVSAITAGLGNSISKGLGGKETPVLDYWVGKILSRTVDATDAIINVGVDKATEKEETKPDGRWLPLSKDGIPYSNEIPEVIIRSK